MKNALALLAMVSCCISLARAAAPPEINLHHSSWSARDGAPAAILSITQTSDGWLWLGGPTGLYRFDGIQFEQYTPANAPLPTRNVSVVNAFADGSLWIGYRTGGVSLLRQGRVRNYGEGEGLPSRAVWSVAQDGDGRIWAATAEGMFYLENQRWRSGAAAWDIPGGWYKTLLRDREGVLWAQGDNGVYLLRPGGRRFVKAAVDSGTGVAFNLPDGRVISWDAAHSRFNQLAGPKPPAPPRQWLNPGDPTSVLFDRRGDLWLGRKDGIEYRRAQQTAFSALSQGSRSNAVGAMFEDSEGNIWAATSTGVERFRKRRLNRVDVPAVAVGAGIFTDPRGGAWIGGFHVARPDGGASRVTPLWDRPAEGWDNLLTNYTRTPDGVLWGGSYSALRRVQGRESQLLRLPAAIGGGVVYSLLAEPDGSVLVATTQHGLHRRRPDGGWEKVDAPGEVNVMARSDAAGLWLGYYPGRLAHAEHGGWRSYDHAAGLDIGLVMAVCLRGAHVWAGGDNGLALLHGERFQQVRGAYGEIFDGISGIVELDNGDLWLNASAGLFRIPGHEIARLKQTPGYQVQFERLDQLDGLEGVAPRISPSPSLALAADGRLWVVRAAGVFRLDPEAPLPVTPARPVLIKTMGPPGEDQPPLAHARFAAGSSALQIDYAVPLLAMPERLRYRYRLDGVDADWQDAGGRRSAYYSNLRAGDYRFRVTASDYNGKWSDQITEVRFSIAPAMTETWWFRALCGVLLLSAAWLAYRWHIGRMARQMAGRLQERTSERERIARELHDTLLQSVQGLILHVHAAVMRLPDRDATRLQLETALRQADEVVDEGRGRIRDLRGEETGKLSFPDALLAAAARLQPAGAAPIQLRLRGTARPLGPIIYAEALAIVTEAIANAYRHADACGIEVELEYGARELRCVVRDDGVGISSDILNGGGRPNHWGLRGMSERAARMGARLALRSGAARGTEWQLALPAVLAYTR